MKNEKLQNVKHSNKKLHSLVKCVLSLGSYMGILVMHDYLIYFSGNVNLGKYFS